MSFSYPAAEAVKGRVLGALLRGELLTHADCWRRLGSSRLAHHVHVLRRAGWPVKAMETIVRTSDAGRPATIAEYFLDQTVIEEVGEEGQQYARECAAVEAQRRAA